MTTTRFCTALAALLTLAACAAAREEFRNEFEAPRATIPKSFLDAVPCISRAAENVFGVPPELEGSYSQPMNADSVPLRTSIVLRVPASDANTVARVVTYDVYVGKIDTSTARVRIKAPEKIRDEWLTEAITPLERCGGTVTLKR
ncbi:MAG: hypothetical protein KIT73_08780 [Burkholderiales bacterium]|nr:hypothetical protein [Burkholderiales bacterium]